MTTRRVNNREWLGMAEQLLAEGRSVRLRVRGGSMRPFLRDGLDEVMLRPASPEQLRVGLIALARLSPDGRYVLHRIDRIEGETVCLQGDGNVGSGERCPASDVLATAELRIRRGRETSLICGQALRRARLWRRLRPFRRLLLLADRLLTTNM